MQALFVLLKKDLILELRNRETLGLIVCLAILLSVVVSLGVSSSFLNEETVAKLYPALLWIIFVFAATISIGRSYEYEQQNRAIEGLILSGVEPWLIYLAKVLSNCCVVLLGHAVAIVVLSTLLNLSVWGISAQLMLVSVFVILGYTALATLLAGIASTAKLKDMLLPLILLPLLFPLFFAALEITAALFVENRIDFGSMWVSMLIGLDVLYLVLGINLYEFVIKE